MNTKIWALLRSCVYICVAALSGWTTKVGAGTITWASETDMDMVINDRAIEVMGSQNGRLVIDNFRRGIRQRIVGKANASIEFEGESLIDPEGTVDLVEATATHGDGTIVTNRGTIRMRSQNDDGLGFLRRRDGTRIVQEWGTVDDGEGWIKCNDVVAFRLPGGLVTITQPYGELFEYGVIKNTSTVWTYKEKIIVGNKWSNQAENTATAVRDATYELIDQWADSYEYPYAHPERKKTTDKLWLTTRTKIKLHEQQTSTPLEEGKEFRLLEAKPPTEEDYVPGTKYYTTFAWYPTDVELWRREITPGVWDIQIRSGRRMRSPTVRIMDTLRMTEVRKYGLNSCEVEERINVKEETTFNLRLNSYTRDVTPTFENTILIEGARDGSAGSFNNRIANVVTVLEAEQVLDNFGVAMIEDPKRIREGRPIDPMEAAPRQTFVRVAAESEVPDGTIEAYKTHVIQTSLVSVGGYCPVFTTGLPDFVPKSEQDPCIILAGDNWHLEQSTWRVPVIIRGRQAIPLGGTFENALRVDINRDGDETVIVEGATVRVTGALRIQPGARLVVRGRLIIGNPAIL